MLREYHKLRSESLRMRKSGTMPGMRPRPAIPTSPMGMTTQEINRRGFKALMKDLGPVGFVRFMQQFVSRGDYTKERARIIRKIDLSDIERRLGGVRKRR
jgi:hypothetical protein